MTGILKSKEWKRGVLVVAGALLLVVSLMLPVQSQTAEQDYAILIVGDEGTAEMLRQEKVLINEMAKLIRNQSPDQRLPIYSYHLTKSVSELTVRTS